MHEMPLSAKSCAHCNAQMPETAVFCPGCGRATAMPARGKVGALPEQIAGSLAYFSFLPAIVFLLLEPYRRNLFVRFHSIQSLMFCGAAATLAAALRLAGLVLFLIPRAGPLLATLIDVLATLAAIFLWMVLVVKALQGELFKLPLLGGLAEQYSRSV